jgi:hypothetical protein
MFSDLLSGKKASSIINPDDLDLKLRVEFDIELKNQTKSKLKFNDVGYSFNVNGSPLVAGTTDQIINNPDGTTIKVSNSFSTKALGSSILSAFKKKQGNYVLKGQSSISLPAEISAKPLDLKFDENGTFNLQ